MNRHELLKKSVAFLATFGPLGYCVAPGTVATLLSAPFALLIRVMIPNIFLYALVLIACVYGSLYCITQGLIKLNRRDDPSEIVIDEAVGTLFLFYGLPLSFVSIIGGLILFRLFDIFKPFGIAKLEQCGVVWGILLDDIAAGLVSMVIMRFVIGYVL